jgi:parallel beta-helix repeat protein
VATIADNYLEQVNRFYILINASDNGTLPAIIPSATVDGNTIIGKGVYNGGQKGIWFNSGAWGIASGNTISNLDFPNAAIEPERASGIVAYGGNAAPGFRRIIVNNTVSASSFINNKGIYIAGTGDSIAGNTITGFRWGIELHDGISTQIVRNTITGGQVGVLIGTNSTTPVTWTTTIGGDSPSDKNIITGQMPHASGGNAIALGFRDLVGGSTFLGTVPIDARNNDFGVYEDSLIRSRIWDRSDTTMIGGHLVDTVHYSPFFSPGEMIRASVKVNLEGPFNTATSLMNTTLYTSGTLAAYFTGRVIPVGAVDSINIEIRDSLVAVRATVRRYCAAWLLADGTIRGFADTTKNYVEFAALTGSYYIAVRQRSHVTIMSAMRQQLSTGSMAMYDFTTSQSSAYGTNSLKPMGARFAMFTGDVNQNGLINAADRLMVKNNTGLGGYNVADANLNGLVNAADRLVVKNNTGVSSQVP